MTDQHAVHLLPTEQLTAQQTADIRELLWAAFAKDEDGAFTEDDWLHSIGGTHFVVEVEGSPAAVGRPPTRLTRPETPLENTSTTSPNDGRSSLITKPNSPA